MESPGIDWSTASTEEARGELSRGFCVEVARALDVLDDDTDVASSVHEARRAIKRARALLRLAVPPPIDSPTDCALREASRALAVLRDADVLVSTAVDVRDGSAPLGRGVVPSRLLDALQEEKERRFTASGSNDGPLKEAAQILRAVADGVEDGPAHEAVLDAGATAPRPVEVAPSDGMELLRLGLSASYGSIRAQFDLDPNPRSADEQSHKLRKRVKDLRYHLEFLATGEPKLDRLVRDLHHLTDVLGDRNDLAILSEYAASADALSDVERDALITHTEGRKQELGSEVAALTGRLFEEDAESFVRRIAAWVSPTHG